jgi:hypothetical protein
MALIVLGVSATFLPVPAPLNEDSVAPAAVSTRSPELGVPPAPTLVPGSHPYQYPAWVEPTEDYSSYTPETGNPGPFPEPAVQRGH